MSSSRNRSEMSKKSKEYDDSQKLRTVSADPKFSSGHTKTLYKGRPETTIAVRTNEDIRQPTRTSDGSPLTQISGSPFRPGRGGFGGAKLKNPNSVIRYTSRPIVPAKEAELISVAKAMHREDFGKNLQATFSPETQAAVAAVKTGHYIGWRCPEYTWDCIRVGETSLCFCGHLLKEHRYFNGTKSLVSCAVLDCRCRSFSFIPSRPEDVGEFWLQRRPGYDPTTWKAKCRCKHTHYQHSPIGLRKCQVKACRCAQFESNFLCAACDRHWEDHETFFETEDIRISNNLPYGEAYIPFAEIPELRNMALTGKAHDESTYLKVTKNRRQNNPLTTNFNNLSIRSSSQSQQNRVNNDTPVPFGYHLPKGSPFD